MTRPLPLAPAAHPDSEPRGSMSNGDPCPVCGQQCWYERAYTGQPMRWVHHDGSPRCPEVSR